MVKLIVVSGLSAGLPAIDEPDRTIGEVHQTVRTGGSDRRTRAQALDGIDHRNVRNPRRLAQRSILRGFQQSKLASKTCPNHAAGAFTDAALTQLKSACPYLGAVTELAFG